MQESTFLLHRPYQQLKLNIRNTGLVLIGACVVFIVYMGIHDSRTDVDWFLTHDGRAFYELENQGFELVKITDGYYPDFDFCNIYRFSRDCIFLFEKDNFGERVQVTVRVGQIESSRSDVVDEVHKLPQPITIAAYDRYSTQPAKTDSFEVDSYIFTYSGKKLYFNSKR